MSLFDFIRFILLKLQALACSWGMGGGSVAQLFITLKRRLKIFQGFQEVRGHIRLIRTVKSTEQVK